PLPSTFHMRAFTARNLDSYSEDALFVVYCNGPHCNGADRAALTLAKRPTCENQTHSNNLLASLGLYWRFNVSQHGCSKSPVLQSCQSHFAILAVSYIFNRFCGDFLPRACMTRS